jgi:histidinol phosphatase-like PHP family hydrolase
MRIDLRRHSKYSEDNHLEPEEILEQAIKLNLDRVCFAGFTQVAETVLKK